MKRSEYSGLAQVFRFTFMQAISTKSLQITTLIMVLISVIAFPVLNLTNKPDKDYVSPVEKVYVINSTDIDNIPYADAFEGEEGFEKVVFEESDKSVEALTEELFKDKEEDSEGVNELVLEMGFDPALGGYSMNFYRDPDSSVSVEDASGVADILSEWFKKYKVSILDADEETLEMVGKVVDYTYLDSGEYLETDEHEVISDADYNIVYIFLMVSYMVVIMASSMVASKVVEEKANRVVEYLMTTVRPMALVLGKVVAMLLVTVGELGIIALVAFASNKISSKLMGIESSSNVLSNFLSADAIKSLSVPNVIICLVMIATGILIFGLLAGLFGASVSKMEDLQQGLKAYNFIILAAFFVALTACEMMWTVGINGFVKFTMLFPFTSVMILPGAILIGKATVSVVAVAIVLQFITAFIVLKIVSMVYETIIVMNGNPVGIKQMIEIIKRRG